MAFIFPIEVDKSQVLLSDLKFLVDGVEADLDLGEDSNRLMWTGRIPQGTTRRFSIRYRARGLDSFLYKLDPSLPAPDVRLRVGVSGGENFDYPPQVLAASSVERGPGSVSLGWSFASLESGVTMGVILPSVEAYDEIIAVMARRAWVPFLGFMALLAAFSIHHRRPLAFYESWLVAAAYGFYFVLLAYLAAFMNFYLAYVLATVAEPEGVDSGGAAVKTSPSTRAVVHMAITSLPRQRGRKRRRAARRPGGDPRAGRAPRRGWTAP